MTESEWLACTEPDLMLEQLVGKISRAILVEYVRRCWERILPLVTPTSYDYTVVDQFAALAYQMSDMDAATYAAEAVLKAAGWAPNLREEQKHQANLLRWFVGNLFQAHAKG
jgi:hypothetical protein